MRRFASIALAFALGSTVAARAADDPRTEELFQAARNGELAVVRRLLDGGLDVNTRGRYGMTALFAIPSKGRLKDECFALLERAGLKVAPPPERAYETHIPSLPGVRVILISAGEIAERLARGDFHAGITGEDVLRGLPRFPCEIEALALQGIRRRFHRDAVAEELADKFDKFPVLRSPPAELVRPYRLQSNELKAARLLDGSTSLSALWELSDLDSDPLSWIMLIRIGPPPGCRRHGAASK